jgi:diguanylate cyclase (GGDEF)-like protein
MNPEQLRDVLEQLERAGEDHARWHDNFTRTLVCRLSADSPELGEDGHRHCRFGQWYYDRSPAELRAHPAFLAMEAEHRRMHAVAARILRASAATGIVTEADFDEYSDARAKLRLELESLRQSIGGLLGNRDPLTGAHRRADLLADLREALALARRSVSNYCIAFMDLDRFKAVNDTHGHRVGDEVLAGAVRYVTGHLRPFDKVYRYGGDEFLISMPGTDLMAGRAVIERIREGLARVTLARRGAKRVRITASFGIAPLEADASIEESIDNADRALLAAKATGRNRSCCWDRAAVMSIPLPAPRQEPRSMELDLGPSAPRAVLADVTPSRTRRGRPS